MPITFPLGHWYGNISRPMRNMRGLCVEIPSGGGPCPSVAGNYILFFSQGVAGNPIKYWKVDEDAGTKVELASFERTPPEASLNSICTDGTFVWIPQNVATFPGGQTLQLAWNCTDLVPFYTGITGNTSDTSGLIKLAGHSGYFITFGQGTGDDRGMSIVSYATAPPASYSSTNYGASLDAWVGGMDFRYGNPGANDYGDALATMPLDTYRMTSYTISGTTATQIDQLQINDTGGFRGNVGWNRDDGVVGFIERITPAAQISFYQVSMVDMTLSTIGVGATTGIVFAVGFADHGIVVTVEDSGGAQDVIRTYSRSGTTLTEQDSYSLPSTTDIDCVIRTNPYTGRVYVFNDGTANGMLVLDIAVDGTITVLATFTGVETINNNSNDVVFLPASLAGTSFPDGYIVDDYGIPVIDDQGNYVVEG